MQHPWVNIAISAARNAGRIISRQFDQLERVTVSAKSQNNFVTTVDNAAEAAIIETIQKAYPNHSILAEESGEHTTDSPVQWIIDPLDGTNNFVNGIPHFAISIGIKVKDKLEHAVVYDPIKNELFTASHGSGAMLNDKRIRTREPKEFAEETIATGFPYALKDKYLDQFLGTYAAVMHAGADIRRQGSAALDLAYVAAGRYAGYYERGIYPWDMAAGALIVKEAGGYVSSFDGDDHFLDKGHIVAAGPKLFPKLQKLVRENYN